MNKSKKVSWRVKRFVERRIDIFIWIFIFFILFAIASSFIFSNILPDDYNSNFVAEIFGVFITIIFLIMLLELREKHKWGKVKNTVFHFLRRDLNKAYTDLSMFLVGLTVISAGVTTAEEVTKALRENFYNKLKERSENLVLDEDAHKLALEHNYNTTFRFYGERIDRFEMKYSKYLDPFFTKSLILIGDSLYGLEFTLENYKKNKDSKRFESSFKFHASRIIKELYELHSESNFDFFQAPPSEKDNPKLFQKLLCVTERDIFMQKLTKRFRTWVDDDKAMRDLWLFCTTVIVGAILFPFARGYFTLEANLDPYTIAMALQFIIVIILAYIFGLFIFRAGKNFWKFD